MKPTCCRCTYRINSFPLIRTTKINESGEVKLPTKQTTQSSKSNPNSGKDKLKYRNRWEMKISNDKKKQQKNRWNGDERNENSSVVFTASMFSYTRMPIAYNATDFYVLL